MTYELCVRGKKVSSTREDLCLSLDIARVRVRPTVTEEGRKCSVQCFDVGSVVIQRSQGSFHRESLTADIQVQAQVQVQVTGHVKLIIFVLTCKHSPKPHPSLNQRQGQAIAVLTLKAR